ncbi:MAG: gliding motility-associated C-terminal domain-containing protein [Prolixibacteraceae bacterium]|jgi:gliding motility-associated-like protein|nr:gliding motility-associated C-terminal domain-containing protein [Prolixibacteraceae bacterium]
MLKFDLLKCIGLAIIPFLSFEETLFSQITYRCVVGESSQFSITAQPGISYCWSVTETIGLLKGEETDKVTYLSMKCKSSVNIKWEKSGTFFIQVTGFNQNGCSNIKIIQVKIFDNHVPLANDDYVSTNWINSISIDLLRNDHDIKGDIDPSSLKILSRPELGNVIPGNAGIITYVPLKNRAGSDRFYYQISDSCSQRDTAMVTINIIDPPLYLPHGISPNGDGHNDRFIIGGLKSYPKSSLTIFSRDGLIIYKNDDYQNDWDGVQYRKNGNNYPLPYGSYYYLLHLGGTNHIIKGFFYLSE